MDTPVWFICVTLILLGVGFALFATPNNNAIMGSVSRQYYGIAGSTLGTMRLVGQATSMVLATLIIDYHIGDTQLILADHDLLLKSFHMVFYLLTVLCICGMFASMAGSKKDTEQVK